MDAQVVSAVEDLLAHVADCLAEVPGPVVGELGRRAEGLAAVFAHVWRTGVRATWRTEQQVVGKERGMPVRDLNVLPSHRITDIPIFSKEARNQAMFNNIGPHSRCMLS